ncbi:putative serine/threonine kinase [Paratrimastix pyriformis]|uniref:Serine/threonine kinase n=1 Tax=Paratrimastix pyriformis TaxID=342808 RepID=A0ABQ8URS1_9EUKA|nr:putative serine/threonine kinase [Paratrimastix pyriformis]
MGGGSSRSYPVFEGRYVADPNRRLGSGSFGKVFEGYDQVDGTDIAIKIEKNTRHSTLGYEAEVYRVLQAKGVRCVPQFIWFGEKGGFRALILECLGPSLEDVLAICNQFSPQSSRKFSLVTVLVVAIRCIDVLRRIHEAGYVQRDIKPSNFVFSLEASKNELNLIDFGLAIPLRRDDMESLGYMIVYLLKGKLPWWESTGVDVRQTHEVILQKKKKTPPSELCAGLPPEFEQYFLMVKALEFAEEPNYAALAGLFRGVLASITNPRSHCPRLGGPLDRAADAGSGDGVGRLEAAAAPWITQQQTEQTPVFQPLPPELLQLIFADLSAFATVELLQILRKVPHLTELAIRVSGPSTALGASLPPQLQRLEVVGAPGCILGSLGSPQPALSWLAVTGPSVRSELFPGWVRPANCPALAHFALCLTSSGLPRGADLWDPTAFERLQTFVLDAPLQCSMQTLLDRGLPPGLGTLTCAHDGLLIDLVLRGRPLPVGLTRLDLSHSRTTDAQLVLILRAALFLRSLSLCGCPEVTGGGLQYLGTSGCAPHLEELNLMGCTIFGASLRSLRFFPILRALGLDSAVLDDATAAAHFALVPRLQHLWVGGATLWPEPLTMLRDLARYVGQSLKTLEVFCPSSKGIVRYLGLFPHLVAFGCPSLTLGPTELQSLPQWGPCLVRLACGRISPAAVLPPRHTPNTEGSPAKPPQPPAPTILEEAVASHPTLVSLSVQRHELPLEGPTKAALCRLSCERGFDITIRSADDTDPPRSRLFG